MRFRFGIATVVILMILPPPVLVRGQHAGPPVPWSAIDGTHLKTYVEDLAAMSRRYRDNGHPQFWGRIIGTDADAENARWLMGKFQAIGLTDVRSQSFDLPPQWMPQSWSVSASGAGATTPLASAQPTYRGVATPAGGPQSGRPGADYKGLIGAAASEGATSGLFTNERFVRLRKNPGRLRLTGI